MTHVATVWIVLALVLGVYAAVAAWSRGGKLFRSVAVLSLLIAVPASAVSLFYTLGYPIPLVEGLTLSPGKHVLLAKKMEYKQAIYLWVDDETPRYYWLPWSDKKAEQMQDAEEKAGKKGQVGIEVKKFKWPWTKDDADSSGQPSDQAKQGKSGGSMAGLFEWSMDQRDPIPYPLPQPKMPEKLPPEPGHEYIQQ